MGICSKHFKNSFIRSFIETNAKDSFCDYCDEEKQCADFEDVAEFIEDAVMSEYCEPYEEGAWYDPDGVYYEDRFPLITVYWTQDLLDELVELTDPREFEIIQNLASSFQHEYLTLKEAIWGPTTVEYLWGGWASFKDILKHKIRFLFFDHNLKDKFKDDNNESINPMLILEEVGKAIVDLGLIVDVAKNHFNIYRARQHNLSNYYASSDDLGSPPPNKAKANRMSPPGISMFYGALDCETCMREIEDVTNVNSAITYGEFVNLKPIKLVDFTGISAVPSIYDRQNRHRRPILGFLLSFIHDMSVPVKPDDSVHIEYIPTQVLTEYIKIKLGQTHDVQGILYNSVKNRGGKCAVLFVDSSQIIEIERYLSDDSHHTLALLNDSIFTELYEPK